MIAAGFALLSLILAVSLYEKHLDLKATKAERDAYFKRIYDSSRGLGMS